MIYLDYAATTFVDEEVVKEMLPFFTEKFGNPSSLHTPGREAKQAIENARATVANYLNCKSSEVIFTGSGTESDNLAIIGVALANQKKGRHIITSNAEHHAVLYATEFLKTQGFEITYLKVDKYGKIDPEKVKDALRSDTILVSIIFANNEIGTINPIQEIAKICREKQVPFHTDACQATQALTLDVEALGVDLLTLNGNKIYGPKGVGALFVRKGIKITPMIYGGAQEFSKRAGTENTAAIVGFAKALELIQKNREAENLRLQKLRDKLITGLLTKIPGSRLNGHPTDRLPNNVNISFLNVEGESVLLYLDAAGICASTGSACSSASLEPSHILMAIGLPQEIAHGSIRLTLGKKTSESDIDFVLKVFPEIIDTLRKMSPLHYKTEHFPDIF
jgi:cysteine desulfurase